MKKGPAVIFREIADKSTFLALMMRHWGSHRMMIGSKLYDCAELPLIGMFTAEGELLAVARSRCSARCTPSKKGRVRPRACWRR
jgi:hypothetical protein